MHAHLIDWTNLLVRVFHLIAGISWIGSSFYFMWLDATVEKLSPEKKDVEGELWMVHGGGFYIVEKRFMTAATMPKTLHWFKWEATLTWISGIVMLGLVYYLNPQAYLLPAGSSLSGVAAIGVSLSLIALAWIIYDLLWASPLGERFNGKVALALSFLLMAAAGYYLCYFFSGRGAFIHIGAMLGTLMVANVWMRILPSQQKMIDATARGDTPDYSQGKKGKRRSVHNSYMTFPVLILMLSGHYPALYSGSLSWLVLLLLFFIGAGIRHVMIARMRKTNADWVLLPVAAAFVAVVLITSPPTGGFAGVGTNEQAGEQGVVPASEVMEIIQKRCVSCHSATPTDKDFPIAPNGVAFDTIEQVVAMKNGILNRSVETNTMPFANRTQMTSAERVRLGAWIKAGAQKTP